MFKDSPRTILFLIIFNFLFVLFPPEVFALDYHSSVEKYKLPNSLTVILEESHSFPLVNLQVWIRTGSVYEAKFTGAGISHLVEHMVYKGTKTKSAQKLAQELQALGGQLSGATSKEYTHYGITVPSRNLIKVMETVHYILAQAEFGEKELIKEKEVIIHEMAGISDNPEKLLFQKFWSIAFQGHPYGEPVIGHRLIFEKITRDDILEYYRTKYLSQNIIIVITGDFNSYSLKPAIEKIWGSGIPAGPLCPSVVPRVSLGHGPIKEIITKDVSKPYLVMGFYGPCIHSPDIYPMDVLAEIVGGGKDSCLVKKLRDHLGLVSQIDAWSYTPSGTGIWGVSADLVISRWELVQKYILKELYRFKYILVKEKELNRAKKRIIRRYLETLETIEGKGADLATNEIYTRNPLFTRVYINGIKNVRSEDVQRIAGKYFKAQFFTMCVLQPKTEEKIHTKVVSKEREISVNKLKLDNGFRALIRENYNLPLITVRLVGLGGLLEEDKPGLSYFFNQLWLKVNPDLVKDIEDCGGSISTYSGNNSFGCTIKVLQEDLSLAMDILRKLIQELPINEEKMELTRKIQLAQIEQEEDRPYSYSFKKTKSIFFGQTHPYRNSTLGTKDSVAGITEEDILGFKTRYLVPENMVLVVSGSVDVSQLTPLVKQRFGTMHSSRFSPRKDFPSVKKEVNSREEFRDTKDVIIILAYPGTTIYSEDRYSMEILEQLFSGLAGSLFKNIREEKALSYSVGALNFMGREPGMFMFYIATDISSVNNAIHILKEEIFNIKRDGIDSEKLQYLKTQLLTQLQQQLESDSGFSLEIGLGELYGFGWDYYLRHIKSIENVTCEDVKRVANKYFRDDWYTLTIVGPLAETNDEGRKTMDKIE